MKNTKKFLAAMCALTFCLSAAACGDTDSSAGGEGTTTTGSTAPPKEMDSSQIEVVNSLADQLEDKEFENKTLQFFSHWDINPSEGSVISAEIQLFRDKYQGVFKWVKTTWDDRYADLGKLVAGGKSPDFFSAMDSDAFPRGAVLDMFQPVDEYVDLGADLWKDVKYINDKFVYQGGHYVVAIDAQPDVTLIYNTKTIHDEGFEDPYELYKNDEWTFTKFAQMCRDFTDADQEKYALDGWWYEKGLLHQSGMPIIAFDTETSMVSCNAKDGKMKKMADAMYDLGKSKVMFPDGTRGGNDGDNGMVGLGTHKTLFVPCGFWGIEGTPESKKHMGDVTAGELALAPMPRADDSDTYYMTSRVDGYVLCKGAPNPELFGAWMNCRMVAKSQADQIYLDQLKNDYGWSDLMLEQRAACLELSHKSPIFEFNGAVSAELSKFWDSGEARNFERITMNRWADPTDFNTAIDAHWNEMQGLLDQANAKVAK